MVQEFLSYSSYFMGLPWLSIICIASPLIAALVILFIPGENTGAIKTWANVASFAIFLGTLFLWRFSGFDTASAAYQLGENFAWIDVAGFQVFYRLGVDGISMPLVVLTGLLTWISIYYSTKV